MGLSACHIGFGRRTTWILSPPHVSPPKKRLFYIFDALRYAFKNSLIPMTRNFLFFKLSSTQPFYRQIHKGHANRAVRSFFLFNHASPFMSPCNHLPIINLSRNCRVQYAVIIPLFLISQDCVLIVFKLQRIVTLSLIALIIFLI